MTRSLNPCTSLCEHTGVDEYAKDVFGKGFLIETSLTCRHIPCGERVPTERAAANSLDWFEPCPLSGSVWDAAGLSHG